MYSYPEPASDIAAQIAYILKGTPKDAVFVVAGNEREIPDLDPALLVHQRDEGTLITTNPEKLKRFAETVLDDRVMADLLGYPRAKFDLLRNPYREVAIAQIRDKDDCVVNEAIVNADCMNEFLANPIPEGGRTMVISPDLMLWRRRHLRGELGGVV